MINARMSENDKRLYSPNRDVAHNFDFVIDQVAKRCEDSGWADVVKLAKEKGVGDDDLSAACRTLCLFVLSQTDDPKESMAAGLTRCGWFDINPYARVIVMAHLGTIMLGMHWAGVREATLEGVGPVQTYGQLAARGAECAKLMEMPRWQRKWVKIKARCWKVWRALWDDTAPRGLV